MGKYAERRRKRLAKRNRAERRRNSGVKFISQKKQPRQRTSIDQLISSGRMTCLEAILVEKSGGGFYKIKVGDLADSDPVDGDSYYTDDDLEFYAKVCREAGKKVKMIYRELNAEELEWLRSVSPPQP